MNAQPHKILFINGPSRSGKDTAGAAIRQRFNWRHYQMKDPLWRALRGFFDVPEKVFEKLFTDPELKEQASKFLAEDIPRQSQISLSEEWAKRRYGNSIFGDLAVRALSKTTLVHGTVITDCGFFDEAVPIVKQYGPENCALMQLHREGCGFVGDSRGYIDLSPLGVRFVKVINCYDKDMFGAQVCRLVERWMEGK